jgi:hypothetical protein
MRDELDFLRIAKKSADRSRPGMDSPLLSVLPVALDTIVHGA